MGYLGRTHWGVREAGPSAPLPMEAGAEEEKVVRWESGQLGGCARTEVECLGDIMLSLRQL